MAGNTGGSGLGGGGGGGLCAHKSLSLVIIFISVFVMFTNVKSSRDQMTPDVCAIIYDLFSCFEKWLSYTHVNESTIFMPVILRSRVDD